MRGSGRLPAFPRRWTAGGADTAARRTTPQHVDPKEAVQIHQDVRSRRSLAIHWGTFPLTDEPMDEPPGLLRRELEEAKLAPEEFVSLRHGASIVTAGGVDVVEPAVYTG